jgi:phosphate ABC transporter phosphate-binding protein
MRTFAPLAIALLAGALLAGCSSSTDDGAPSTVTSTGGHSTQANANGSGSGSTVEKNPYAPPSSTTQVYGSGATFPKPLIESWGLQYNAENPKVQVSYAGGGSGKGITDITNKDVLFAGSDAPMSPSEKSAASGVLQFPETIGAEGVVYNVESIADGLKLDGETLGKVFTGAIKKWNDPAIAALNPGTTLPSSDIAIVYRSDSSGTTYVFTDYLGKASTTWASTMGAAATKKPDWTKSAATQLSGNGNDGVGTTVKNTPNSIGYVELAYVNSLKLKAAQMKSHDGAFLKPTTAGAAAAANEKAKGLPAPSGDWSAVSIVDAPGANSYPISSMSYILVYDSLSAYSGKPNAGADNMQAFKAWMWWCLHDGQVYATALGYAPLPNSLVDIGEGALASIH